MFEAGDWYIASSAGKRPLLLCWFLVSKEHRSFEGFPVVNAARKLFKIETCTALVFCCSRLYFGSSVPLLLVNSAEMILLIAAGFGGKFYSAFFICWRVRWPYLSHSVYEMIICVRLANENAGNIISGVEFLIISNSLPVNLRKF